MSVWGKRNVVNKVYKALVLLLLQSDAIVSVKPDSKLHRSMETGKATWCFGSSPAMRR